MPSEQPKINILIVDDNPTNLLTLEAILQAPDRNLVLATSGDEALRYLLHGEVAVILLDVYMPGINGLETAALIRGRERSRDIPIIFITADSMGHHNIARGYSLGAVDYILKPVDPDVLRSKVAVFVELFKKTEEVKRQADLLHEKNVQLEEANLERLSSLIDLGQRLAAEHDPLRVLEKFCHAAREIVGAQHAGIGMLHTDGQSLRHFFSSDIEGAAENGGGSPRFSEGFLNALLVERRPVRLNRSNIALLSGDPSTASIDSFLAAPIFSSARKYGWFYLAGKLNTEEFNEADERLAVTLATQVAVFYENARLYEDAQQHAALLRQEVAERKQAEEERARLLVREQAARVEAERANLMKDEFLATLSHELRTPLTAILGWIRLMRTKRLDEEGANRALDTIERNAHAQKQLIDDLLDVSRIITGKLKIDFLPVNLAAIVESAVDTVRPAIEAKAIQFQTHVGDQECIVWGDANRLQQVVWNLYSNAVKFTPNGGRIDVALECTDSAVKLSVSDNGIGIDPSFLPYIFDRFRQADGTTTRKHGGLGLGLAIVRHLVELHGGTITAENRGEREGAVFSVLLPLASKQQREPQEDREESTAEMDDVRAFDASLQLQLAGLRVLVVDDEPDTRDLIIAILQESGADVRASDSAARAVEDLQSWDADLLISDIGMPGEDGYSLIEKVRRLDSAKGNIPAVALTAYAGAEDRTRVLAAGFQLHLAKPIEPEALVAAVANAARRNGNG